mmetsp:Transcript_15894/g.26834  ORF Transcript_15894/g.26834 Transcript_15894/m.26834 type:complete len:373 (-) Transcript_15894:127-1245(-)
MADVPDTHVRADELRQVKELLWTHICSTLPPAEVEVVKAVIGAAKVDLNEQLFEEVSALSEILGEVRIRTDADFSRRRMLENPSRNLLEGEIRLLVDNLRRLNAATETGGTNRRKVNTLIPNSDKRQQQILDTMTSIPPHVGLRGNTSLRPPTPRTPPSRPDSSRSSRGPSEAGSACSSHQEIQATLEPYQAKLNAFDVDAVRDHVVDALAIEHDLLLDDVSYFHLCLEEQADLRHEASQAPASIHELRALGSKLQAVCVEKEQTIEHGCRVNRMLSTAEKAPGRVGRLRSIVEVSRDTVKENQQPRPPSLSRSTRPVTPVVDPKRPTAYPKRPIVDSKRPIVDPQRPIVDPKRPLSPAIHLAPLVLKPQTP